MDNPVAAWSELLARRNDLTGGQIEQAGGGPNTRGPIESITIKEHNLVLHLAWKAVYETHYWRKYWGTRDAREIICDLRGVKSLLEDKQTGEIVFTTHQYEFTIYPRTSKNKLGRDQVRDL